MHTYTGAYERIYTDANVHMTTYVRSTKCVYTYIYTFFVHTLVVE